MCVLSCRRSLSVDEAGRAIEVKQFCLDIRTTCMEVQLIQQRIYEIRGQKVVPE